MSTGTVKRFDSTRGFGATAQDDGADLFARHPDTGPRAFREPAEGRETGSDGLQSPQGERAALVRPR
ncbi:cold shock CspA family protein [Spinactinospora alkalitolerans]|uniref:Cold shock CspA family protein n=1 Tax=Spinactinospora alkalitolerans TaxID=687207 RepID=A0A852TVW4_9ACTN|nr:cold-shock protein [Spinactinospora alkalitolerans]NYE47861.1 cold shock CspA family protein [Spinactinospora alkalitolerans]